MAVNILDLLKLPRQFGMKFQELAVLALVALALLP